MFRITQERQVVHGRFRRNRIEGIGDVRQIGGRPGRGNGLMLILEAREQGVTDSTGGNLPDRLELIVVAAVPVVLLAKLPADDFTPAHHCAGAITVAQDVQRAIQVGESITDGQKVADLPAIGEGGTHEVFMGEGERRRVLRIDRNPSDGRTVEVDEAVRVRRFAYAAQIQGGIDHMIAQLPLKCRPGFVVATAQVAKPARVRDRLVHPVVEPLNAGRAGDIGAAGNRVERAELQTATVVQIRRRGVVNDIDRPSWRTAAEQGGAWPFENFDPLDTVQGVRDSAELIAVGETITVDLRVQTADQKMIVVSFGILATRVDAAGVVNAFAQHGGALFLENLPRNDLDAGRYILELRARFAEGRHLFRIVESTLDYQLLQRAVTVGTRCG